MQSRKQLFPINAAQQTPLESMFLCMAESPHIPSCLLIYRKSKRMVLSTVSPRLALSTGNYNWLARATRRAHHAVAPISLFKVAIIGMAASLFYRSLKQASDKRQGYCISLSHVLLIRYNEHSLCSVYASVFKAERVS